MSPVGEVSLSEAGVCLQPPLRGLDPARFQPHVRITPRHLFICVSAIQRALQKPGERRELWSCADTASSAALLWKHQVTFLKFLIRKSGDSLHKKKTQQKKTTRGKGFAQVCIIVLNEITAEASVTSAKSLFREVQSMAYRADF